ncbi:serine/threonine protein kinase, CMGC group [Tulasnella sp. 418]|nr:serine/threonine protein kinase, CMGC group [Tulasnella sp. 418]
MDETEQYPAGVGDTICDSRYNIIRLLGGGIHATVWLAFDKIDNHHVSIKISKSQLPTDEPTNEVEYLRKIAKANPNHPGYIHVLHFLDAFHLRGSRGFHQCIVTEVLGPSIHTFRTTRNSLSLPLHIAKAVTFQLLLALDYLHNTCGIIHTDLKADNILVAIDNPEHAIQEFLKDAETSVVKTTFGRNDTNAIPVECTDPSNITIKLIDYGNACWTGRNSHDIQPFAYRAPEVILGAEWGSGVDIWNLACMVYEITTSRRLFYAEREDDGVEKLKGIMKLLGPIPPNVIKSGTRSSQFFDDEGEEALDLERLSSLIVLIQ